ncbi:ribonuclease-like, putative [Bodo saltans]|uniref:Ribonuclease-like, putative n=1 Tax=Bodo saltans TaxID=75058 RepID=A0A0S4JLM5_BODSA|nr:ribonuclease-like, putative [Bodo saltans]|eukprot:CUG92424.1 ribonuclease-like, putative [Bodo saltans]
MYIHDVYNEAIIACARGETNLPWWSTDEEADTLMMSIAQEGRDRHSILPSSTALSRVFFDFNLREKCTPPRATSRELLHFILDSKEALPAAFKKSVDEKVVAVGLRFALSGCATDTIKQKLASDLMDAVPADTIRRRMFTPVFEHCAATHNTSLMQAMLARGLAGGMEFWDSDFQLMLQALSPSNLDTSALTAILHGLIHHQPVVGARNASLIKSLLGGQEVHMPSTGRCPQCGEQLTHFEFTEAERSIMVEDIMEKLIRPRIAAVSHYQPNLLVDDAMRTKREEDLGAFLEAIKTMEFDAVIDGANVGYYGLSHWYSKAKRALLESRGLNVEKVSYGELHDVPFPVDVSPQFSTLDEMVTNVRRLGYKPLIVLHERHTSLATAPAYNAPYLQKWRDENVLLPSPGFLNDDYCWLLAAMMRKSCAVVTNDLMRDHHFGMLSQRSFLRWRQRVRIPYKAFVQAVDGAVKLNVLRPSVFSTWTQQDASTRRWHVPFLKSKETLDQATNKIRKEGDERDDLDKDGGDHCEAWICTDPFA